MHATLSSALIRSTISFGCAKIVIKAVRLQADLYLVEGAVSGLSEPVRLDKNQETTAERCQICCRKIPESLNGELRCFLHFMEVIETELGRFIKLTKRQAINQELENEVIRFVVDSSLRITSVATGGCGLDLREKRKFASLLMDLVTFRDDINKAARRAYLVN